MRPRILPIVAMLALAACGSTEDIKPSPIPANARGGGGRGPGITDATGLTGTARGESIDRLLAVVEGKPLFLSTLSRRLGIKPDEVSDPDNEVEIQRETMAWAKEQIFEKAAERIGLQLQPGRVDSFVADRMKQELERAEKELGQPVTQAQYLANERLSYNEFREQQRGLLMRRLYIQKMLTGIGSGTRPQVDLAVSPSEVRRIYREHREMFDEQAGVRLAQFRVSFEQFERDDRDFLEVEEIATKRANEIGQAFSSGMAAPQIARRYGLKEEGVDWVVAKEKQYASRAPDPAVTSWMLDPLRKQGDYRVLPLPTGIQVLGVMEARRARRVPFDEAYPKIVEELTFARTAELESRTLIDLLSKSRAVWPESLADALVEESRGTLAKIRELEHLRGARLR